MRAAVILAAVLIKSYLWIRLVPRLVRLAVLAALAALAIVMCSAAKKPTPTVRETPFCSYPIDPAAGEDFPMCEFKLRLARNQ